MSTVYWAGNLAPFSPHCKHLPTRNRASAAVFRLYGQLISTLQALTTDAKVFWLFQPNYTGGLMGPFVYRNQYAAFVELLLAVALFNAANQVSIYTPYVLVSIFCLTIGGLACEDRRVLP
jgi:hypothetical protein